MKKAFIQLHIAVLLAGFTGILGKLIHLNEGLLVWYRLALTAPTLWLLALLRKQAIRIGWKEIIRIFGVGGIAALHWVTFYGSIKYANVSVSLLCFSSIGFFTALIEPLMFRHKIDLIELLLGGLVIVGIFFIFQFDPHYKVGIIVGLISALLGSLFPVLNKRILERVPAETVTLYELTGGLLFLTALMPLYLHLFPAPSLLPGWEDWIWLLILAWACTVLAFNLSMSALQKVSAFTVNLSYNLEPVYGILLAFLIFREDKYFNRGFYVGMFLIVLSIVLQTVRLRRRLMKKAALAVAVSLLVAAGLGCWSGNALAQMVPLPGSAAARKDTAGKDPFKEYARLFGVPHHYVCYTTTDSMRIDGRADEPGWKKAPWTEDFSDIEGDIRPRPTFRTRAKMLWDKNYLYIYAELEEPALQGVLLEHDTIIFQDNDFEVFLNPENTTHNYFEIETNALGTIMDLFMFRPYRDGGKALMSWDVQGICSAVHRKGTINHPGDTDEGWSVEMAIPLASIRFFGDRAPRDSTVWRINFSRVEWDWDVADGRYVKRVDTATGRRLPEHNWVWSPQGIVDMHAPERWGWLQFSSSVVGRGSVGFVVPPDERAREYCWLVYYKQREYRQAHGSYARTLKELGFGIISGKVDMSGELMTVVDEGGRAYAITMESMATQYMFTVRCGAISGVATIDQDGLIKRIP